MWGDVEIDEKRRKLSVAHKRSMRFIASNLLVSFVSVVLEQNDQNSTLIKNKSSSRSVLVAVTLNECNAM